MRKRTVLVLAGLITTVITLRSIRNRRAARMEGPESAAEEALEEAKVATEHATAAANHTRTAGEKASEYARQKVEQTGGG
jgi:hypothetical protein